ncbi:hypothetical protein Hanom_Chr07g00604511 [Helianthus anomalus]
MNCLQNLPRVSTSASNKKLISNSQLQQILVIDKFSLCSEGREKTLNFFLLSSHWRSERRFEEPSFSDEIGDRPRPLPNLKS